MRPSCRAPGAARIDSRFVQSAGRGVLSPLLRLWVYTPFLSPYTSTATLTLADRTTFCFRATQLR
jgi:hypothetical protein